LPVFGGIPIPSIKYCSVLSMDGYQQLCVKKCEIFAYYFVNQKNSSIFAQSKTKPQSLLKETFLAALIF